MFSDGDYKIQGIGRSVETDKETEDKPEKTKKERKDGEEWRPKRKPRGALFHSGDPMLAQRVEEELYDFDVESFRSRS